MLDPERLRKILPDFANKSLETDDEVRKGLLEFQAADPQSGKITEIKLNVGRNLKHYGIEDTKTKQLIFMGHSQLHGSRSILGLGIEDEIRIENVLREMDPKFWIVASVQLPESRFKRVLTPAPAIHLKWMTLSVDYGQYPLLLQIAAEETGEVRRLNFPPGLYLNKKDKEVFTRMLPLLSLVENITDRMEPVTNPSHFPLDYFKQKDTTTFLLPELF